MPLPLWENLPGAWFDILKERLPEELLVSLDRFLAEEYKEQEIFPPYKDIFHAFCLTPPEKLKVLLLGQDPYHEPGQAHGLAFSVPDGVKKPPSLRNILKEYERDTQKKAPRQSSLEPWAKEGVLLLNTVLTVRAHKANSHKEKGWEIFTDSVISAVNDFPRHIVFLLWGNPAQKKLPLIDSGKHTVITSAHPSPLSAYRGFFGSSPFSRCNEALLQHKGSVIDWSLEKTDKSGEEE